MTQKLLSINHSKCNITLSVQTKQVTRKRHDIHISLCIYDDFYTNTNLCFTIAVKPFLNITYPETTSYSISNTQMHGDSNRKKMKNFL